MGTHRLPSRLRRLSRAFRGWHSQCFDVHASYHRLSFGSRAQPSGVSGFGVLGFRVQGFVDVLAESRQSFRLRTIVWFKNQDMGVSENWGP